MSGAFILVFGIVIVIFFAIHMMMFRNLILGVRHQMPQIVPPPTRVPRISRARKNRRYQAPGGVAQETVVSGGVTCVGSVSNETRLRQHRVHGVPLLLLIRLVGS